MKSGQNNLIGIREPGLLTRQRPHTDTLLDAGAAVLDDTVLQRPRLLARELEIQICEIHRMIQHIPEYTVDPAVIEAAGSEYEFACDRDRISICHRSFLA